MHLFIQLRFKNIFFKNLNTQKNNIFIVHFWTAVTFLVNFVVLLADCFVGDLSKALVLESVMKASREEH